MRRIAWAGAIGALPGLLIALVPLGLHGLGLISSDQSQIGFIGVPVLFLGLVVGVLAAASETSYSGIVAIGLVAGLLLGVVATVVVGTVLRVAGLPSSGVWLVVVPVSLIAGAAAAARHVDRRPDRHRIP